MRVALACGPTVREALAVGNLEPYPSDAAAWRQRALRGAEPTRIAQRQTASGWSYAWVEVGERTIAFYKFFEYGCVVSVALAADDEVLEALDSAEPEWGSDGLIVCLAELFVEASGVAEQTAKEN